MSNYSPITDFSVKDALSTGDPDKLIVGADFDAEFDAIKVAVDTKYDPTDLASQAQAEAGTDNTVLMTPLRTEQAAALWGGENAGVVADLQALTDPGADRLMFWDDSVNSTVWLTAGTGLDITGTTMSLDDSTVDHDALTNFVANEHINHASVTFTAGNGISGGGTLAANRTFTFAPSELSVLTGPSVAYVNDSIVVDDNGTPKRIPFADACPKLTAFASAKTLADGDQNQSFVLTGATGRTVTIDSTFNTASQIGTVITFMNADAGEITVAGSGITLTSKGSNVLVSDQGGAATVIKIAASEWLLFGDLA